MQKQLGEMIHSERGSEGHRERERDMTCWGQHTCKHGQKTWSDNTRGICKWEREVRHEGDIV